MDASRFEQLLSRYQDGDVTPADLDELEAVLRADASRRRAFAERILLGVYLHRCLRSESGDLPMPHPLSRAGMPHGREAAGTARPLPSRTSSGTAHRRRFTFGWAVAVAAAAAVLLVAGSLLLKSDVPGRRRPSVRRMAEKGAERVRPAGERLARAESRATAQALAPEPPRARPQAGKPRLAVPIPLLPKPTRPAEKSSRIVPAPGGDFKSPPQRAALDQKKAGQASPTEQALGRIDRLEGRVLYARGAQGRWLRAVPGIRMLAGDRLQTRSSAVARLALAGGATVYVNKASTLRVGSAPEGDKTRHRVDLLLGEVYVVDGTLGVEVWTPEGRFVPVGTRFNVRRSASTTILAVEQGSVEAQARARRGKKARNQAQWIGPPVRVEAGQQARVRRGMAPRVSRIVSLARLWRGGLTRVLRFNLRKLAGLLDRKGDFNGLACAPDGTVWVAFYSDPRNGPGALVHFDPRRGAVVRVVKDAPTTMEGVTWEGTNLVVQNRAFVFRYDVRGRQVSRAAKSGGQMPGLAYDGRQLWATRYGIDALLRVGPAGQTQGRLALDLTAREAADVRARRAYLLDLTWDGRALWVIHQPAGGNPRLLCVDPRNGKLLKTLSLDVPKAFGLGWDGRRLWVVGSRDLFSVQP